MGIDLATQVKQHLPVPPAHEDKEPSEHECFAALRQAQGEGQKVEDQPRKDQNVLEAAKKSYQSKAGEVEKLDASKKVCDDKVAIAKGNYFFKFPGMA